MSGTQPNWAQYHPNAPILVPGGATLSSLGALGSSPAANTFATCGTSREAQQNYFGNSSWNYFNQGNYQGGYRYQLLYNGGISGAPSRTFLNTTLAAAMASGARYVILGGVINDAPNYTATAEQIWDSTIPGGPAGIGYLQACQQIIANGQVPILQTEYMQEGQGNATTIAQCVRYNQLVREYCATGAAILLDFASAMWNPLTTTATYTNGAISAGTIHLVTNSTQDGVHPNQLGGYMLGQVFHATMGLLVPPLPILSGCVADQALANNLFISQTGGTTSGGGTLSSGALPAGWSLNIPTGMSVAASYVTDPSPGAVGYGLQLAVTNSSAGATDQLYLKTSSQLVTTSSLQFQAGGYVSVASGASNFLGAQIGGGLYYNGGNFQKSDYVANAAYAKFQGPPSGAYAYTSLTPPSPPLSSIANATPNPANVPFWIANIVFSGNGSGTITFSRTFLRAL